MSDPIRKLTEFFSEFPGIGPRQAKRFVYFLLSRRGDYLKDLTSLLSELPASTNICQSCFRFFPKMISPKSTTRRGTKTWPSGPERDLEGFVDEGKSFCQICQDKSRDRSLLTIVSRDIDLENIEKAGVYNGLYFVLGGIVPILEKKPEIKIRQKELVKIVEERLKKKELKEIILAMNLNPEGENTAGYLEIILKPLAEKYPFKISTLGRGLSTGTELEYSDTETIKNALKNRAIT